MLHTSRNQLRRIEATVLMCLFVTTPVRAQQDAIDPRRAAEYFAEAEQLSKADGGTLWKRPLYGPMLFADPRTRTVAANEPDEEGKLLGREGVYVGELPPEIGIANYALKWAGKHWTMVMWPLPEERIARGRLMLHECFHRIQDELGLPAGNPANAHLDGFEGRAWMQLEWRALAAALEAEGGREPSTADSGRRQAIEDALVLRAHRHALCGGQAAEEERELELNEGLANYTGYRLSGAASDELPGQVAKRLRAFPRSGLARSFAYTSGPAIGLLLDSLRPKWREGLNAKSDLAELLADASGFKRPEDIKAAAERAAKRYDGEKVIEEERLAAEQAKRRAEEYRKQYLHGPVLRLPFSDEGNYTFDPTGVTNVDESHSVYSSLRVVDAWGVLEAERGAMLVRREKRVVEVVAAAPKRTDEGAAGEGWTLRLKEGWRVEAGDRDGELVVRRGSE